MRCPSWLGKSAKKKWAELVKQIPTLSEDDTDTLALLCMSWQTYFDTRAIIDKDGYVLTAQNGRGFINPAVNANNEAHKQIVKLSKAFGLSPDFGGSKKSQTESPLKKIIEER